MKHRGFQNFYHAIMRPISLQQFRGFHFILFYFIYFLYSWLHWVFVAACGPSLVAARGSYSSLQCFALWWLLLWSTGSRHVRFRSCGMQAQQLWHAGSVVVAHGLQSTGSVVVAHGLSCSTHMGSSPSRDQTCVPCIGTQILNHCATRKVPGAIILKATDVSWKPEYSIHEGSKHLK